MPNLVRSFLVAVILALGIAGSGGGAIADPFADGIAAKTKGDYATALAIFRPLAEHGDAKAQNNLGFMYDKGLGVTQDYEEAVKWYRLAADQGNAEGQVLLGVMYGYGNGVAKDDNEGVKWFRLAAMQGSEGAKVFAHFLLSAAYRSGRGVAKDEVRAYMWLQLWFAESHDDAARDSAAKEIEDLEKEVTPAQIAKAKEMAKVCKASNYKDCD